MEIGKIFKYIIYPKDIYGNDIDDLNINLIKLLIKNENKDNNVQKCNLKINGLNKELKYNIIEYENILNIDPDHNFELLFDNFRIKCINCNIANKNLLINEVLSKVKEEHIFNDEYIDTIKII